jgi:hypothetical protein
MHEIRRHPNFHLFRLSPEWPFEIGIHLSMHAGQTPIVTI